MADADATEPDPFAPRRNHRLIGHQAAEAEVRDAHAAGRLAHAWLITGPRGVGKATLAFRMARFLLASTQPPAPENGPGLFGDEPAPEAEERAGEGALYLDPEHPVFRRVAAGSHADFQTVERGIDAKTKKRRGIITVDEVRQLGAFLTKTPAEGGWRAAVIDSADEMNANAANAVLKSLEEPPARAVIILVSHNPGRLLPTLRSRCRRLALGPLADDQVVALLHQYLDAVPDQEALRLAGLGEGSIGRAMALAQDGGLELYDEMIGLIAGLPGLDVPALHRLGDRLARPANERAYRTVTELLLWWLARLVRSGAGAGAASSDQVMQRLLGRTPLDRWIEVWEKISRLIQQADGANLDRKQLILNAFLALQNATR